MTLPPFARSLSARLLVLTVAFVMLSEVLIYLPSVARFRAEYMADKVALGHLAALSVEAAPEGMVTWELEMELLAHVGAHSVDAVKRDRRVLMLMAPDAPKPAEVFRLDREGALDLIRDAVLLMLRAEPRAVEVWGPSRADPGVQVGVVLDEAPMRAALLDYSGRIMLLSVLISLSTAAAVYVALHLMTVRPMRRLAGAMVAFRRDPESTEPMAELVTNRSDEVGIAQRELISMQAAMRQALRQRQRLAALGTAVTKINHDLRGILATAGLLSERLLDSADPEVRRVGPRLLAAIERAATLCGQTLSYTRDGVLPLRRETVHLRDLVEEAGQEALAGGQREGAGGGARWVNRVPETAAVLADREQLHRVLVNLARNAMEAGAATVTVEAVPEDGRLVVTVADDGPGLAPRAREHLFQPFSGTTKPNGTGLGLAIVREIMRAHGGEIRLVGSTATGTAFALTLPAAGMSR